MDINSYLEYYCHGNKAEFARRFNRLPQNVTKLFNNPDKWLIHIDDNDHYLVQIRAVCTDVKYI